MTEAFLATINVTAAVFLCEKKYSLVKKTKIESLLQAKSLWRGASRKRTKRDRQTNNKWGIFAPSQTRIQYEAFEANIPPQKFEFNATIFSEFV